MVISGNEEGGEVDAVLGSEMMMIGVSKSNSNDDGKLMDIEIGYDDISLTNISKNMGGLLVSFRRCLSVEGSAQSSIRRGTLGDMTLTSRIRCRGGDGSDDVVDRFRMDRPKRTCCGCGWAAVVVTPRRRIDDKREGRMKRKVMVDRLSVCYFGTFVEL